MKYSHFDDVAMLLIELCQPMSDDEIMALMDIKASMSENKDFDTSYTAAVKGLYVKNFHTMKNNKYQPQKFADLNEKLLQGIKNKTIEYGVLPSYLKVDNTSKNEAIRSLRAKIAKLRNE